MPLTERNRCKCGFDCPVDKLELHGGGRLCCPRCGLASGKTIADLPAMVPDDDLKTDWSFTAELVATGYAKHFGLPPQQMNDEESLQQAARQIQKYCTHVLQFTLDDLVNHGDYFGGD